MADMDDFEDQVSGSEQQEDSDDEEQENEPPKKKARLSGASASSAKTKAPPKAKAKSSAKSKEDKQCYISGCENKKTGKHKSCSDHKKVVDAILYQAEKQGKKAEVEKVLSDSVQAAKAIREFLQDNPPGKFRKKLIDFTQWLKTYSTETSLKAREWCELYTFQDFSDEKTAAGWEAKAILDKWQSYESDPAIEREDDGLWLPKRKQKIRDQTKRVSQSVIEASKAMKNTKPEDLEALKQFALTSAASHTHAFLRGKDSQQKATASHVQVSSNGDATIDVDEQEDDKKKKGKKVDLANALPTLHEKESGQLNRLKDQMEAALSKATDAIKQATTAKLSKALSPAGQTFFDTCVMRKNCAEVWLLTTLDSLQKWEAANKSSHSTATINLWFVCPILQAFRFCAE